MRVGILAVQGDFEAHARVLQALAVQAVYVTHPKHLTGVQGLILPGGESTTMLKFLLENEFAEAMADFTADKFLFGTCAGAILLAEEVLCPSQPSLKLIDVTIERNAYGRQLASYIGKGTLLDHDQPIQMVFIRAPKITRVNPALNVFATYEGQPVGVSNDRCMITTFHPELTNNLTIHRLFLERINAKLK